MVVAGDSKRRQLRVILFGQGKRRLELAEKHTEDLG